MRSPGGGSGFCGSLEINYPLKRDLRVVVPAINFPSLRRGTVARSRHEMAQPVDFSPLVVVTTLAVVVPLILRRFTRTIPIVAGELISGILVGPSGLNLIAETNPWLDFLKLFGFSYLMFLSGLEVDFDLLLTGSGKRAAAGWRRLVSTPLRVASLSFAATLSVALFFSFLLARWDVAGDPFIMTLILSTTSLGIVMPVLKERRVLYSAFGQHLLVGAVVWDFATLFLVGSYVSLYTSGLTIEIFLVLVLVAATFLIYRLAHLSRRHMPLERLFEELSHATGQLDVRGALALAVVFIALAQSLGVEVILGAFLAGAIVSLLSEEAGSSVRPKLNALGYGFFIPIFFVMVGVEFKMDALTETPESLLLAPALVAIAFLVKYAGALVYRPLFSWREVLAIGSLSSARLSLIIAVAAIGLEIGAITEAANSAIILVATVTVVAAPLAFNQLIAVEPDPRRKVIIVGSPPHAQLLAQRLQKRGEEVVIVAASDHFLREAAAKGLETIRVEPKRHLEAVMSADLSDAHALVCMLDEEEDSLHVAKAAKHQLGIETVVGHVRDPAVAERLRRHGIEALDPNLALVLTLELMVCHPQAVSLLVGEGMERHSAAVKVRNPNLVGRTLREIPLPGDALVLVLSRAGEALVPRGHTALASGDLLTVVGSPDSVEAAVAHLSARGLEAVPSK